MLLLFAQLLSLSFGFLNAEAFELAKNRLVEFLEFASQTLGEVLLASLEIEAVNLFFKSIVHFLHDLHSPVALLSNQPLNIIHQSLVLLASLGILGPFSSFLFEFIFPFLFHVDWPLFQRNLLLFRSLDLDFFSLSPSGGFGVLLLRLGDFVLLLLNLLAWGKGRRWSLGLFRIGSFLGGRLGFFGKDFLLPFPPRGSLFFGALSYHYYPV